MAHIARLIAAAAHRLGREVGAVGFNQQPVARDEHSGFLQLRRLFEGHRPREADIEAKLQVFLRNLEAARKAVNDPVGELRAAALRRLFAACMEKGAPLDDEETEGLL